MKGGLKWLLNFDETRYFIWLKSQIDFRKQNYNELMERLFTTPFRYVLDRDKNRVEDALMLRRRYRDFMQLSYDPFDNAIPSVLEVLIALAIRVDKEYLGDPSDPTPGTFFWIMIKNLGLDDLKGYRFSDRFYNNVIDAWLDRKFMKDGVGSPFPVRVDSRDQRKFEMWDQMNHYIYENYYER